MNVACNKARAGVEGGMHCYSNKADLGHSRDISWVFLREYMDYVAIDDQVAILSCAQPDKVPERSASQSMPHTFDSALETTMYGVITKLVDHVVYIHERILQSQSQRPMWTRVGWRSRSPRPALCGRCRQLHGQLDGRCVQIRLHQS